MKNIFKLQVLILAFLLSFGQVQAQNPEEKSSTLIGTAWRMVSNVSDGTKNERTMYFKKNLTFESKSANGMVFNGGRYTVLDYQTFLTVHEGSQTANLYHFEIENDTLHFKGNYIDSNFDTETKKVGFYPIDEIWVKIPDWKDVNEGIQFVSENLLSSVLEKSEKEGKLIFMDCYTHWCGPCKYLSANIFTLKTVGDFFNKNFINVKFDMESPEGKIIAAKYGVKAYPTLLFINSKGEVEHTSIGCGGEEHLLKLGKTALDTLNNLKAIRKKIAKGDRTAETIVKYLSANNNAADKDKLLNEYFKNKTKAQMLAEDSWKLYNYYDNSVGSNQFKFFVKNRADFEKIYGKKEVKEKFQNILYANMRDSVKYKSLEKIDPALFSEHKAYTAYQKALYLYRSDKKNKVFWINLLEKAYNYTKIENDNAYEYNELCWLIYENYKTFDDTEALKLAKKWSYKSLQLKPDDMQINDTYAHILFDLGFVDEAIRHQEIALKKGEEAKSPSVKFFSDELKRFKDALK